MAEKSILDKGAKVDSSSGKFEIDEKNRATFVPDKSIEIDGKNVINKDIQEKEQER